MIEIKRPKYTIETISLIKADVKNPNKLPKAALKAIFVLALFKLSPTKAPTKGPKIIPPGIGDSIPKMSPTVVPIIPAFVPPNRFVPIAGMM